MGKPFRFKQFEIRQEAAAMKVSTDGILLGAWAALETGTSILDIGTGTGLLALMSAQRNPNAQIIALDLDEAAAAEASENVAQSPWAARMAVHQ
ncbi:MAG: 50S ribosomal protein L11 methyltransferase, partial [Bacteroidota bacterium]